MRECDDGFVVGDGSLWVHVMSVEYRNAIDKVAYTLFCTTVQGLFACRGLGRAPDLHIFTIQICVMGN